MDDMVPSARIDIPPPRNDAVLATGSIKGENEMRTKLFLAAVFLLSSSATLAASPSGAKLAASCCQALACCGVGLPCCG